MRVGPFSNASRYKYEIRGFETIDEISEYCELMSRVPMKLARLN